MLKKTILRSVTVILILALSIGAGIVIDKIFDEKDRKNNPMMYSQYVTKYSRSYGVPEDIIYAVIKCESNFDSSLESSSGAVGLMQISPSMFEIISKLLSDDYEFGMLYDPETNIKYGTYYLSYLYSDYARWPTVYAAYNTGTETVDRWLENPDYSKDGTSLYMIPYEETRNYVDEVGKTSELYLKLYYSYTK